VPPNAFRRPSTILPHPSVDLTLDLRRCLGTQKHALFQTVRPSDGESTGRYCTACQRATRLARAGGPDRGLGPDRDPQDVACCARACARLASSGLRRRG
jgi:hypothetical protein